MGGVGSGGFPGFSCAPTCESAHSIDLAYLRRHGFLSPGRFTSLTWSRRGQRTGSIDIITRHDGIRLGYHVTDRHGERITVDEFVPFAYTATCFGGRRQWLTCLKCGRRCRKIYGGRYFRCRQCHGLVHASTREPAYQRALDRAEGMRKRLGAEWGSAFEGAPLPPKPPRMRWVTYRRLEAQYEEQQNRWAVGVKRRFGIVA
jgi:DNA-directed RNA polymerase subunit RPC12/RpoP